MTAKDLMIDFANYIFVIIVSLFFVFYFILGDRIDMLINILKSMTPLAIFGLAFLFKLKAFTKSLKKSEETADFVDDELWYISRGDVLRDRLTIVFLPLLVLAISFIDGDVSRVDIIQAIFCFFYFIFFHWFMFRQDSKAELHTLNKNSKTIDDVVIYFFPIAMLGIAMSSNSFDTVDILQTVSVFSIMIIRHYIIFKKES